MKTTGEKLIGIIFIFRQFDGKIVKLHNFRPNQAKEAKPTINMMINDMHRMSYVFRNLYFRTNALISLNIYPIFVMDGDAPELKKETLEARRKAETQSQNVEVKSLNRTRLKGLMNESKKLLEAIGVLVVKSNGEAEKMCAQLNANNVVSAVISGCSK